MKMSSQIVVTGGAGFIGSHLVRALVRNGNLVSVLDNFSRGKPANLANVPADRLTVKSTDLTDPKAFGDAMEPCDLFFHLAAINGTGYFYTKPDQVLDLNTRMMINAVELAISRRVERFVFFSSSETYQLPPQIPTPEEVPLVVPDVRNPRFTYAISKIVGEAYCHHVLRRHGVGFTIIRPHNFYGPQMGFKHVIPEIALRCLRTEKNGTLSIQGSGEETRSFCYIDDAVDGIIRAAFSEATENETIHIGSDKGEIAIGDLIALILKKLGRTDLEIRRGPAAPGSVVRRCPDISKARRLLGFDPKVGLEDGLDKTLKWVREQHKKGAPGEE